jgi:LysR family hydrogen peroxide-inducible transcriptional activator
MDLRQLNALVAIAEHGSFSAAADALATVQSNVSTHIKKLEIELGSVLVDRGTGELTEAGVLAVERARRVIGELDALTSDVTALSQEIIGTVQLGLIGTAALWLVPEILDLVPTVHPHLHLIFREATTHGLDAQLAAGEIDLGVLALPASGSEVHTVPLFEEDLGLFLPRSHPLAARSVLTVADLASLSLLLPVAGSNYRTGLDTAAAAAGVTLHPRAELDSLRLMRSLMGERCGFAILPASAMPRGRARSWVVVPVEGVGPRVIGVAQRRRALPGAPVRAVLALLTEILADPRRTPVGVRPIFAEPRSDAGSGPSSPRGHAGVASVAERRPARVGRGDRQGARRGPRPRRDVIAQVIRASTPPDHAT